jgi:hypothetical protein
LFDGESYSFDGDKGLVRHLEFHSDG